MTSTPNPRLVARWVSVAVELVLEEPTVERGLSDPIVMAESLREVLARQDHALPLVRYSLDVAWAEQHLSRVLQRFGFVPDSEGRSSADGVDVETWLDTERNRAFLEVRGAPNAVALVTCLSPVSTFSSVPKLLAAVRAAATDEELALALWRLGVTAPLGEGESGELARSFLTRFSGARDPVGAALREARAVQEQGIAKTRS